MAKLDIKVIEIVGSFAVLAIFIILCALVNQIAGAWSNIAYVLVFLAFTVAMCVFGLKLSPRLSD